MARKEKDLAEILIEAQRVVDEQAEEASQVFSFLIRTQQEREIREEYVFSE